VQLTLERRPALPMVIVVRKGATPLTDDVELVADRTLRADLRAASQVSLTFPQTGGSRIVSGSRTMEACFNVTTGTLLRRLRIGRDTLFEAVVAQLGETESYKRKLGAMALGEAGDARALPHLQRLADGDSDPEVRAAAKEALARLSPGPTRH
jgi:hypothetical protein